MKGPRRLVILYASVIALISGGSAMGTSLKGKPTLDQILAPIECATQIRGLLKNWKASEEFSPRLGSEPSLRVYAAPSDQIGRWIELRVADDFSAQVHLVSAESVTKAAWKTPGCVPAISVVESHPDAAFIKNAMTDERLKSLIQKNPEVLVYAWSPGMPYSVDGLKTIQQVGKRLKMKVIPVLDSRANSKASDRMASVELFYRGMTLHYPSVLIVHEGKIKGPMLPGFAPVEDYVSMIKDHF